eukprot:223199_1
MASDITDNWWFQLINIPILVVIFLVLYEFIFRRCTELSLWLTILSLIAIPFSVVLIPMDWIQFVMLISLCLSAMLATFYRYSHHKSEHIQSRLFANNKVHKWSIIRFKFTPFAPYTIYIICVLDLLVTAIKELVNAFHWNAISALFLCFTFPIPSSKIDPPLWSISAMKTNINQRNDLLVQCSFGWIVCYTSFAACYIYANYLDGFVRGLALLLIPLIYMFFDCEQGQALWVQTRLFTLWFYYVVKVFSLGSLNKYMYCTDDWRLISDEHHQMLLQVWGFINAILSVVHFLYWVFHLTKMTKAVQDLNNIQKQMVYDEDKKQQFPVEYDESEPLSPAQPDVE